MKKREWKKVELLCNDEVIAESKHRDISKEEIDKLVNVKCDDYVERSACCDAPIKWGDICSQCGEHTEPISEEEWNS